MSNFELQVFNRAAKIHRGWSKYSVMQEAFALRWMEMAAHIMADSRNPIFDSYTEAYHDALERLGYYTLLKSDTYLAERMNGYGRKRLRTQE